MLTYGQDPEVCWSVVISGAQVVWMSEAGEEAMAVSRPGNRAAGKRLTFADQGDPEPGQPYRPKPGVASFAQSGQAHRADSAGTR